jgi:hypothetical protein
VRQHQPNAPAEARQDAALDRLLDAYTVPPPRPGLATRIVAAAPAAGRQAWSALWWPFGGLWQPIGGLAAAAIVGLVVGLTQPPAAAEPADELASLIWTSSDWLEPRP